MMWCPLSSMRIRARFTFGVSKVFSVLVDVTHKHERWALLSSVLELEVRPYKRLILLEAW